MNDGASSFGRSAYGGSGWSPRLRPLADEIGTVWAPCGIDSEWAPLEAVVVHRPGDALQASADPDAAQMLALAEVRLAQVQHDAMVGAFEAAGVTVHRLTRARPAGPTRCSAATSCSRPR
jgi:hypothetical protein